MKQIQATVLVIRFVRDKTYWAKGSQEVVSAKKFQKKIPKKKRLTNTI